MADKRRYYPRGIADDLPDDILPSDYFVIPATDERGHSSRIQCRLSPELDRQIDELVASRRFPFKTKGDAFRFCVFDGIRRLLRYDHTIDDFTARLEMTHIVLRRKLKQATFDESINLLGNVIDELRKRGAKGEILGILNEVGYQVQKCIEIDPVWGARYKEEVENRFGYLRRELESERPERYFIDWGAEIRRKRNGDE